ncbi:MAG: hypothetical protein EBS83_07650, partial [Planctomycetia bacterium]|nr:hypothetical protein [Planctomycetia bacterium]
QRYPPACGRGNTVHQYLKNDTASVPNGIGRRPELSVKPALPTASRRQDAANEHQQPAKNIGFLASCPEERPTGCRRFP